MAVECNGLSTSLSRCLQFCLLELHAMHGVEHKVAVVAHWSAKVCQQTGNACGMRTHTNTFTASKLETHTHTHTHLFSKYNDDMVSIIR